MYNNVNNNKSNNSLDMATEARLQAQIEQEKLQNSISDEIQQMKKTVAKQKLKTVRAWFTMEYKDILAGKYTYDDIPQNRKEAYAEYPEETEIIKSILETHFKASKRKEEYIQI